MIFYIVDITFTVLIMISLSMKLVKVKWSHKIISNTDLNKKVNNYKIQKHYLSSIKN